MSTMEKKTNDFIVESLGHCFLCMSKIPPDFNPLAEPESDPLPTSSIISLQYLANYLQMDLQKVFTHGQTIPHHLLARISTSELKVHLCQNCSAIGSQLAKLIQQLEKVELDIRSNLEIFRSKLLQGDGDGADMTQAFPMSTNPDDVSSNTSFQSKLEIMRILRAEAQQKCSSKLTQKEINEHPATHHSYFLEDNADDTDMNIKLDDNSPGTFVQLNEDEDYYDYKNMEESATTAEQDDDQSSSQLLNSSSKELPDPLGDDDDDVAEGEEELESSDTPEPGKSQQGTPKRKYPCKYCDKEFHHKPSYFRHYNAVHACIQYQCPKCHKRLSDSSNLRAHLLKVHSQERSHACHVCGSRFKANNDLRKHLRRVHSMTI